MMRNLFAFAAILGIVSLTSCQTGSEDASQEGPGGTETVSAPIINGDPVAADLIGTPWLANSVIPTVAPDKHGYCSSTVLGDRWVLTARHCVTQNGERSGNPVEPWQMTITLMTGATATGSVLYTHPTSDVALLKADRSLLSPTGHPWGTPLFWGRSAGLTGAFGTLYCQGWGLNTPDGGWGTLRSARIQVAGLSGDGFDVGVTDGKIPWKGDSGSSCYVYLNGHYNIVGVASTELSTTSIHYVGVDRFRDWVEGMIGNAVAVFTESAFTGASQLLVPGGRVSGNSTLYDLPQLTIGNDSLTSLIIPSVYSVSLYRDAGFQNLMFSGSNQMGDAPGDLDNQTSSVVVSGGARFFVDGNFGGSSLTVTDTSVHSLTSPFNNSISSLTVPSGWTVTLYDNASGSSGPGARVTFTEGTYSMIDSAFNDKASYITVREPVALYADESYAGAVSRLIPGCYDTAQMGIANEAVSSVAVPPGLIVQLFQETGLTGTNYYYTASYSVLPKLNNQNSSVCVYGKPTAWCGSLQPGEALLPGDKLWSCDQRFYLTMQIDGNLVLYQSQNGSSTALWSSRTWQTNGKLAVMQDDGNFVLYDSSHQALWSASTWDHQGAYLTVQNDGNLVVYQGTTPLWASGTCCH